MKKLEMFLINLAVCACGLLKVATKGSIRDKKDSEELDF